MMLNALSETAKFLVHFLGEGKGQGGIVGDRKRDREGKIINCLLPPKTKLGRL